MIENTRVSLKPTDLPRQTAKGIIQYTLFLDYKNPKSTPNDTEYISKIVEATDLCCFPLISQTSDMVEYNFFGLNTKYSTDNLLYLNRYPPTAEIPDLPQDISFSKLLVQNSLMSAYHVLLTEYLNNCTTTSYQIVNQLKGAGAHKAMSSIKNGHSCVVIKENKTECLNLPKYGEINNRNSSNAATFGKKYATRLAAFPTLFAFTGNKLESGDASFSYNLQYTALTKRIVDAKHDHLNCIFKFGKKNVSAEKIAETLPQLINHFTPAFSNGTLEITNVLTKQNNDIVDEVYEYYLAEKAFSLNLFYSTLKIIQDTEKQHNNRYDFKHTENLRVIAKCKQLSCPFVAPYLLRFAFDHIDKDTTSYSDYWNRHSLNSRDIFASRAKKPGGFHYDQWLHQFELFVDYLSSYIIPVYDWCFLSMLLEGIEKTHAEYSHLQCLELAITMIGNYIQANAKSILFPLKTFSQKKVDDFFPTGVSIEWVDELRRLFYNEHNVNLNIAPLTCDMFTSKKFANDEVVAKGNLSPIRDLYIESIINPY